MSIRYYLQPNPITPDPNDQSARVETLGNLTPDTLAQELVNRGVVTSKAQGLAVITGYEPERCRWNWGARPPRAQPTAPSRLAGAVRRTAPFGEFERARVRREGAPNRSRGGCAPHPFDYIVPDESLIAEKVADGYAINTPLLTARPGINGVFTDPTDTFDSGRHVLRANFIAGPLMAEKLATATTEKTTKAERAPVLTAFINKNTGGVNATITPGGIGQLVGEELKFDPAKAADGIYFKPATGSAVKVTVISTRTEGELLFLCPTLAAGTWHVEVRRTYGTATPVVRTGELSAALTVA